MSTVDLGIDLGTTMTKVAAVDEAGAVVGDAAVATAWSEPGDGRSERTPESVVEAVEHLLDEVVAALPAGTGVRSVGITSMAEAGTLLDADGAARSPVMAWHDPRGDEQAAVLPADLARAFPERTGLPVGHVATLFKLLWLRDEGLDLRGLQWLGAPELVVHRLGGRRVAERSLLGRTGFFDVHTGGWWGPGLDLLGVDGSLVPDAVAAGEPVGTVRADHPVVPLRGAVLTMAGHDHAVAAAATGCGTPGSALDSFGTAEAWLAASDHVPEPAVVGRLSHEGISVYPHVVRGSTALIGGTRTGLVLKRVQRILGATEDPARSELDAAALLLAPGDSADVRVTGFGMEDREVVVHLGSDHHTPAHVWRAALDGGTARGRAVLATLERAGVPVERIVVAGGWARMRSVVAARGDLAPLVEVGDVEQPGTWGAARFGAWAATGGAADAPDPRPPADWFAH